MTTLEHISDNSNERHEEMKQSLESSESLESVTDMQFRLDHEMNTQNEKLKQEDLSIENINNGIELSQAEILAEKDALGIDAKITDINLEADRLLAETKGDMANCMESNGSQDGINFLFQENPELEKIGTKEDYKNYIENIFPESKVKDILYHYSSHEKIKEEGFKFFTELEHPAGAGEIEAIWFTKKPSNYWGGNDLRKYAVVINAEKPLDARAAVSEKDESIEEYNKVWKMGTDKEFDPFDKNNKHQLQKNRRAAFEESGYDSILTPNLDEVAVFNKANIHTLGSSVDLDKFKNFLHKQSGEEKK